MARKKAQAAEQENTEKTSLLYRVVKFLVLRVYPKIEFVGTDNLPDGPAIVVGNHTQMNGPLTAELYFPDKRYIWCAGQMMHLKEVPAYAYQDFWSQKPRYIRWYYKLASFLIAPLAVCIFNNAHTIPVYRDRRIVTTFKTTITRLQEGNKVIIFPEYDKRYNNILYDFQEKFIDTAKQYYKRTGQELPFVPMYIAPALKKAVIGTPIQFDAANPIEAERKRIRDYLMRQITEIACSLPVHTVTPYRNIPKKDYPKNLPLEVYENEETNC